MARDVDHGTVVETIRPGASSPVVLVCEHASARIPDAYDALGLAAEDRFSHAVWDPGAEALARAMSSDLDASLVAGRVSRLIYDCNRPPTSERATPDRSELIPVPGNFGLTSTQRATRTEAVYDPFKAAVAAALDAHKDPVLVTVHSFTPTYFDKPRLTQIGLLHDTDARLVDAMLAHAAPLRWRVDRNAPYGPGDGVTHTLQAHALPRGIANVMIEVRNDLLTTDQAVTDMAAALTTLLKPALADLTTTEVHHA